MSEAVAASSALYKKLSKMTSGYLGPSGIKPQLEQQIKQANKAAKKAGKLITGYKTLSYTGSSKGGGYKGSVQVPIYGISAAQKIKQIQEAQAESSAALTEQFNVQQADIANTLKIIQEEKSAVSKMTDEYTQLLIKEAEAKKKAQEQALLAAQVQAANQAMASKASNFQIAPAGQVSKAAGTTGFKKMATQFAPVTAYGGLGIGTSGMVNV